MLRVSGCVERLSKHLKNVDGCTPPASQQYQQGEKRMNTMGIDVGKRRCRAAIEDNNGQILNEFFFRSNKDGITKLANIVLEYGKCKAVVESTANMWIRIYDAPDNNGIDIQY
jgi:hypothetical protein